MWIKKLPGDANCQEISRSHTRAESEESIAYRWYVLYYDIRSLLTAVTDHTQKGVSHLQLFGLKSNIIVVSNYFIVVVLLYFWA